MSKLTDKETQELLTILQTRFQKNISRHSGLAWEKIQTKLESNPEKLWSLLQMEQTGGEPDVVIFETKTKAQIFIDSSAESPNGRRSLCYDPEALASRKEFKPKNSAQNMAKEMGIEILTEEQYKKLQELGEFDTKTSSWLQTPDKIRQLGGAIFADRRYNHVFVYHNGAESYYASRGFRGYLKI